MFRKMIYSSKKLLKKLFNILGLDISRISPDIYTSTNRRPFNRLKINKKINMTDYKLDKCKICYGDNLYLRYKKNQINLIECNDCLSLFADITEDEYNSVILNASPDVINDGRLERNRRRNNLNRLLHCLQYKKYSFKTVLDFGCGDGSFVRLLNEFGYEAYGVDLIWGGTESFIYKNISEISKLNITFDLVIMVEVIEHLYHPMRTITEIESLLNDKAVLYLESSFIDSTVAKRQGENWSYIDPPRHITFLSARSICLLLRNWININRLNENVFLATYSNPQFNRNYNLLESGKKCGIKHKKTKI